MEASTYTYIDLAGHSREISLAAHSLAFTYCQVPFVYQLSDESYIQLHMQDGSSERLAGNQIPKQWSEAIMNRDGAVVRVDVGWKA